MVFAVAVTNLRLLPQASPKSTALLSFFFTPTWSYHLLDPKHYNPRASPTSSIFSLTSSYIPKTRQPPLHQSTPPWPPDLSAHHVFLR